MQLKKLDCGVILLVSWLFNRVLSVKNLACRNQVGLGVHPAGRCLAGDGNADLVAVPQCAQLFQRLDLLDGGGCQLAIGAQEAGAVGIDADVAQHGHVCWKLYLVRGRFPPSTFPPLRGGRATVSPCGRG